MQRIPFDHWLLALRTVLAVWLALYVSLRLDLSQPAWAILAVMIVTLQPVMFTGGTPPIGIIIGRSLARFFGTLFGAIAGLVLIACFAQQPMLYLLFAGGWLALCTYYVMLEADETVAYVMMLSGYTATLVSLTAIGTGVDQIWSVALSRFTETSVGIGAGLLMHIVIAPRFGSRSLPEALSTLLSEAAGDSLVALEGERSRETRDRHFTALLGHYQQFEKLCGLTRRETRRYRQFIPALDRFASDSLALITALRELDEALRRLRARPGGEDRLAQLTEYVTPLLHDIRHRPDGEPATRLALPEFDWSQAVQGDADLRIDAELVHQRLNEVLGLLQHGRRLRHALDNPGQSRVKSLPRERRPRAPHNEHFVARYNALRVFIAFELLGQFWIHSGWHSGYLAMMLLSVFTVLFARAPNPAAIVYQFMWGSIAAVVLGGIILFLILPVINGFPLLALTLGLPVMIGTLVTPYPRWSLLGLSGAVTMMTLLNLHTTYSFTPARYINGGLASIIGTIVTMITYSLFRQRTPAERMATLLEAYWAGLARIAGTRWLPNRARLESRLYDRLGRLVALGGNEQCLREAIDLHALALCVWRLRHLRNTLGEHQTAIETWLREVSAQLERTSRHEPALWHRFAAQAEAWAARLHHETQLPVAVIGELVMLAHLMRNAPGTRLEADSRRGATTGATVAGGEA
ncbi:FUSC family protein [Kushneria phosphatilytica]|nr:FUSC family protein [Kushneria phosphatilytica]